MNNIPWDIIIDSFCQQISTKNQQALSVWLSEEENRKLYDELQQLYLAIRQKSGNYTPDKNMYWDQLSTRLHLDEVRQAKKKQFTLPRIARIAVVAAVALAVVVSSTFYLGRNSVLKTAQQLSYSTYGGKSRMVLPDGTEVWLHGTTTISYPSIFEGAYRKVFVTGEAYFEVTKDPSKPFLINALDQLEVKVLGTKFNVTAFPADENIVVSLNEGAVQLTTQSASCLMQPGDEATYHKKTHELIVQKNADVNYQSLWKAAKLQFTNETLGSIAVKLEKWYGVKIEVDEKLASHYSYTFTLRDEPLEEILRIMNRINPMKYTFIEHNQLKIAD